MQNLILNRYRPITQAGHGGFSTVDVAWDTQMQRRVAIKRVRFAPDQSPDSVPGLTEARTFAKLSNSSIVGVYDYQIEWPEAYIIMELVDGITLSRLLEEFGGPLPLPLVSRVFTAVAKALTCAHGKQVLHLDIKPDNVLIDREGNVKVTDFGMAVLATQAGFGRAQGGTIGYMPLEQMCLEPLDERCDQWALAALTYEMLVGENPFFAPDLESAKRTVLDAEVIIPSRIRDDIPEELDDVLFCALSIDREDRFDSVTEFSEAMKPFLKGTRKGKNMLIELVERITDETHPQDNADPYDASGFDDGYGSADFDDMGYDDGYDGTGYDDGYDADPYDETALLDYDEDETSDADAANQWSAGPQDAGPQTADQQDALPHTAGSREAGSRTASPAASPEFWKQILTRAIAAVGCGFLALVALCNVPDLITIAGRVSPLLYGVTFAVAGIGAALPCIGTVTALLIVACGLWFSGGPVLALVTAAAAVAWALSSGRFDKTSSASVSCQGLLGLIGMGPAATIAASPRLDAHEAAAAAAMSVLIAVDFAAGAASSAGLFATSTLSGTPDIVTDSLASAFLNWDFAATGSVVGGIGGWAGCWGSSADASALGLLKNPGVWVTIVGWIAAGGIGGWFGGYNKRFLRIFGVVLSAAVLLAVVLFASGLQAGFDAGVPALSSCVAVVAGAVLGIVLTNEEP